MKIRFERNNTSTVIVIDSRDLYFLGLSLRNTSKALIISRVIKEVMFLYGIEFRDLVHAVSTNVKKYRLLRYMKLLFRSIANIFGYGSVLNQ